MTVLVEKEAFIAQLSARSADDLAALYLAQPEVAAFPTARGYEDFKSLVATEVADLESVAVVGTGNWRYSLNPEKNFKPFDNRSDIDVAVVSSRRFNQTWEELRRVHRSSWYRLDAIVRQQLRRNGENVYAGFASPAWIPDSQSELRYSHKSMLNRLSNRSPGRREVKLLYFKNSGEALDYYKRGFALAQKKVSQS